MKRQIFYRIAIAMLFLCCGRLLAAAQTTENLMAAQIPFEFQVGKKVLPAGYYVIKRNSLKPQKLMLQCRERKAAAIVFVNAQGLPMKLSQSRLTFKEYDGKYFLAGVWSQERATKFTLTMSKTERRLAQLAQAHAPRAIPADLSAKN